MIREIKHELFSTDKNLIRHSKILNIHKFKRIKSQSENSQADYNDEDLLRK